MTDARVSVRVRVLATLVAFMFAALVTRLWFLQVLAAEKYRRDASQNAVRTLELPAPRGRILDANGDPIVHNRLRLVVTVNRTEAGDDLERVVYQLAQILDVPNHVLAERLTSAGRLYYGYQPVPVAIDVSKRIVYYIAEHEDELPGVSWAKVPVRTYPLGSVAAHVLGTLGQVTEEQLKDPTFAGYEPGDVVGQTGLERQYEHDLVGTPGVVKYRVNSAGDNLGPIGSEQPRPGKDLQLTLDAQIQQMAEEALEDGIAYARRISEEGSGLLAATGGAVVVMDPNTGAVKAMASFPTFEPSLFVRGMTTEELDRRFGERRDFPLFNRAVQGLYPPGSTYKPFVMLSALKRGLLQLTRTYPCPPIWEVPESPLNEYFRNWTTANFGYISLAQALYDSCDTVFYPLGFRFWQRWYPTRDSERQALPMQQDLRAMGFGDATGIDVPFERAGRVPDPEWKRTYHRRYPELFPDGQTYPGDFILMTIGQGDTLVTPLQIATAYAGLANDGKLCWPHIVDRVLTPDGEVERRIRPRCGGKARSIPVSKGAIRYVKEALAHVPTQGTAAGAFRGFPTSQVHVAGKTGTAEIDYPANVDDYSWFAAMTDDGSKEYVVVALVEQGGHGSTTAAPIVRRIIEGLYGLEPSGFIRGAVTD